MSIEVRSETIRSKPSYNYDHQRHSRRDSQISGLDLLFGLDSVYVRPELDERGKKFRGKYTVTDRTNLKLYDAEEFSGGCAKCCCGPNRKFSVTLEDNFQRKVIKGDKASRCCCDACCSSCTCCRERMTIQAPLGYSCGSIRQRYSGRDHEYDVYDADNKLILILLGPRKCYCEWCCCCCNKGIEEVKILTQDGRTEIGTITQDSMNMRPGEYKIEFPHDLDVNAKSTLLTASFLMNHKHFNRGM